jgi:hypothetical protein
MTKRIFAAVLLLCLFVSVVYAQSAATVFGWPPADGSVTNAKLAEPVSVANGGTGKTTAAEGLAALGGASLNGSSTVDFAAQELTAFSGAQVGANFRNARFKNTYITPVVSGAVASLLAAPGGVGYEGIVLVRNAFASDANRSTSAVYSLIGRGTSGAFQVLQTADGATSAAGFTIAISATVAGQIEVTNTSGADTAISITFLGQASE